MIDPTYCVGCYEYALVFGGGDTITPVGITKPTGVILELLPSVVPSRRELRINSRRPGRPTGVIGHRPDPVG